MTGTRDQGPWLKAQSALGPVSLKGSQNNDAIVFDRAAKRIRTRTNRAGGVAGGISNGEEIVVRIAVKPASSIVKEQETVTRRGRKARISVEGRHDPCICPRVVPVPETMVALTMHDHLTRQALLRRTGALRQLRDRIDLVDESILFLLAERQELVRLVGRHRGGYGRKIEDLKREREILSRQLAAASNLDALFGGTQTSGGKTETARDKLGDLFTPGKKTGK